MVQLDLPALPMTAEAFERLPAVEGVRLELWEGCLVVAAAAQQAWHSEVTDLVRVYFARQGFRAIRDVGVAFGTTVVVPDVTIFRADVVIDENRSQFAAADVESVVEVLSPDSRERDRAHKPRIYARAGIPGYWVIDQESGRAVVDQYGLTSTSAGDQYVLNGSVELTHLD